MYLDEFLLKDAAKSLSINYSTAKTILRIFRIEKRFEKKNAEEEKKLKKLVYNYKLEYKDKTGRNFDATDLFVENGIRLNFNQSFHNIYSFQKVHSELSTILQMINRCYQDVVFNQELINTFVNLLHKITYNKRINN